jgi:hypothetical protein
MSHIKSNYVANTALFIAMLCFMNVQAQPLPNIELSAPDEPGAFWNFDDNTELPAGWKVEATRQRGPLATWKIIQDKTAPSQKNALALVSPNHDSGSTFNLFWTKDIKFLNGEIEVSFKALKGVEDQGGGVVWRAQDKDNYYIARFNPLEDNFRIYTVHDGSRNTIASVNIALSADAWHSLKIVQQGHHFQGFLDGKKVLEGENDLFPQAGGVGLWTKADAATAFDNFSLRYFFDGERK